MKKHNSFRGWFAHELYQQMKENKDIVVLTADLGFGMFDKIRDDFGDRFFNVGAREQAMVGMAVGLALEGKIPICYSITPFVLYRPFEWIRNYLHKENIPVILVGAGRDKDYKEDGFTHWANDAKQVLDIFPNIEQHYPQTKENVPHLVKTIIKDKKPCFLSLRR